MVKGAKYWDVLFCISQKPLIHAEVASAHAAHARARLLQRPQKAFHLFWFSTHEALMLRGLSIVSIVCLCFFFTHFNSVSSSITRRPLLYGGLQQPLAFARLLFIVFDRVYSEAHRSNSGRANNIWKIHKFLNYSEQTAALRNAGWPIHEQTGYNIVSVVNLTGLFKRRKRWN